MNGQLFNVEAPNFSNSWEWTFFAVFALHRPVVANWAILSPFVKSFCEQFTDRKWNMHATREYISCVWCAWWTGPLFENWHSLQWRPQIAVNANTTISVVPSLACSELVWCRPLQIYRGVSVKRCYETFFLLELRNLIFARDLIDKFSDKQELLENDAQIENIA